MSPEQALTPEQAVATARAVTAAAGADPAEGRLAAALGEVLPEWDRSRCRGTAREALFLQRLLAGPSTVAGTRAGNGGIDNGLPALAATTPAAAVLALCLARPVGNPLWADFRRLTDLLRQLEVDQRAQRRRALFPGPAGRRAAAEARGTRAVMSRAVAGFAATWGGGGQNPGTATPGR